MANPIRFIRDSLFAEEYGPWYLRVWVWWLPLTLANGTLYYTGLHVLVPINIYGFMHSFDPTALYTVLNAVYLSRFGPPLWVQLAFPVGALTMVLLGDRLCRRLFPGRLGRRALPKIAFNLLYLFLLSLAVELVVHPTLLSPSMLIYGDAAIYGTPVQS